MALKYIGSADTFNFEGKIYAKPELYRKHPHFYDHSYDTPIAGLTKERAAKLSAQSSLHLFEDEKGNEVLEEVTAPSMPSGTTHDTIKPEALKELQVPEKKKDN